MKPDWKDAPIWAKWLAQNRNGCWYFYAYKPRPNKEKGIWKSRERWHGYKFAAIDESSPFWLETLEQPPSEIPKSETD